MNMVEKAPQGRTMSDIPDDIAKAANEAWKLRAADCKEAIAIKILSERKRCIQIVRSISPHNEAEAHLIETIVRRIRGEG